jgi:beta-lactamase superfamily II metal-dependent hydrolase
VLQHYQALGATVWRTDLDGAVSASSSRLEQAVSERQRQARFWRWTRLPPERR